MNLIFFGDGAWATTCLHTLLTHGYHIPAVVLRHTPTDHTLADLAKQTGIATYAPARVNDPGFVDTIRRLGADLHVSYSYDQLLRHPLIDLGFINCHAGKLPDYRGRSVVNWAMINGETDIGLTVHHIDDGIDTGDIIVQKTLPIDWHDTYGSLLTKIAAAFPDVLLEALRHPERRTPQAHLPGSYFCQRQPGDEWLDWHDTSFNLYNKIRALSHPGPGARTNLNYHPVTIRQARYDPDWPTYIAIPGEIVGRQPGVGVTVKTANSILAVDRVTVNGQDQIPAWPLGTRLGTVKEAL